MAMAVTMTLPVPSSFNVQSSIPTALRIPRITPLFWPWETGSLELSSRMGPILNASAKTGICTLAPTWIFTQHLRSIFRHGANIVLGTDSHSHNNVPPGVMSKSVAPMPEHSDTRCSMYPTSAAVSQLADSTGRSLCHLMLHGPKRVQSNINIATKFAAYPWRLTPGQFEQACKSSLSRLQLEQLAIGQLHWSTANYAPLQEKALWNGLIAMYEKGLVRAVGVSNYGPQQLIKIYEYLKARGVPLSSAQVQFSLLSLDKDQMVLKDMCDALGIQLISYSPLGLGMLTGKYSNTRLPQGPRRLLFSQILPRLKPLLMSLRDIAKKRGKTVSQVAINWCICKGTIPIPGVKTLKQAQENLGALGWRLSSEEIFELESAARESPGKMVQNIFQTR